MSESLFGLRKRPFAALPDVECFVPLEGICQAFDSLLQAAADGRGIGVLTAPAGLGKTLVCQRLARELSTNFRVAFLPSGNFLTRRSLLQAILFELGHSFVRMSDQELRLALSATLHAIRPAHRGLVVVVDEAHLLAARMLEELRALLSFGEAGEPLVRLIVSGQLSLEETLSRPQCDAFNQRIACQVMLPTFSREESCSYLARRLAWAGANISEVFAREAVAAICEAADGVPRCLHQLADHCLTMGANRSEKPISIRIVREALDHLKQLPLNWAEPTTGRATTSPLEAARAQAISLAEGSIELDGPMARKQNAPPKTNRERIDNAVFDTYPLQLESSEADGVLELQTGNSTWELDAAPELVAPWMDEDTTQRLDETVAWAESSSDGTDLDFGEALESADSVEIETHPTLSNEPAATFDNQPETLLNDDVEGSSEPRQLGLPQRNTNPTLDATVLPEIELPQLATMATVVIDEEVVIDRYAALDSALNRLTRTMLNVRANARRKAAESIAPPPEPSPPAIPVEILDAVHQQFDVVLPEEDSTEDCTGQPSCVKSGANPSISAGESRLEKGRVLETIAEPVAFSSAASVVLPAATTPTVREAPSRATRDERRPYQLLFSELRRRRRKV
jgi:type II secretory pathway predicted ATPase ExeA